MSKLNLKAALEQVEKSGTLCSKGKEEVRGILAAFAGEKLESEYVSWKEMKEYDYYIAHIGLFKGNLYFKLGYTLFALNHLGGNFISVTCEERKILKEAVKERGLRLFKGTLTCQK